MGSLAQRPNHKKTDQSSAAARVQIFGSEFKNTKDFFLWQGGTLICKEGTLICKGGTLICKGGTLICKAGTLICRKGSKLAEKGALFVHAPLIGNRCVCK